MAVTTSPGWTTALSGGSSLVQYLGHGSVELVSAEGAEFNVQQARALKGPAALYVDMTYLNGFFHDLYTTDSLAEALMKADGGASAVIASSAYPPRERRLF